MRRQRNADATCKRGINEVDMSLAQNPLSYHFEFGPARDSTDRLSLFKWTERTGMYEYVYKIHQILANNIYHVTPNREVRSVDATTRTENVYSPFNRYHCASWTIVISKYRLKRLPSGRRAKTGIARNSDDMLEGRGRRGGPWTGSGLADVRRK